MVGAIDIRGISKRFSHQGAPEFWALKDVSLTIQPGEFVSMIGPSGCGKSTLLRIVAGLIASSEGTALLDGETIDGPSSERGFVFQEHTLFPWLNISQNVAFGLKTQGIYKTHKGEVEKWLDITGLKNFAKAYPHQLSGGMCQRACLARSLAVNPKVLLLDEPLGALDAFTRMYIQDELLKIRETRQTTMFMVTHDVDEAVYLSDRVVIMTPRPGRIDRIISIDLPRPRARSDEDFLDYRKEILNRLHFGGTRREPDFYI